MCLVNIWQGKELASSENREPFAKISFTDTLKMYLAYALTVAYEFAKLFLTNSFYVPVWFAKISPSMYGG